MAAGVSVVMLLCDGADIPEYAHAVIVMDNCVISSLATDKKEIDSLRADAVDVGFDSGTLPHPTSQTGKMADHEVTFEIRKGHVRYGAREILRDIDWCVRHGECWSLSGGYPQAYANDITLFDRKRGSGESIWEIKDSIGYVSPEMQLYFRSTSSVLDIVVQGMRNSLNKFKAASEEEKSEALIWLELLGISHIEERRFSELSSGEQRLVLVARALIKQPPLLVLDEPLHGLDSNRKQRVKSIIDALVSRNGSSLIFVTHYTSEIPSCVTHTKTLVKI